MAELSSRLDDQVLAEALRDVEHVDEHHQHDHGPHDPAGDPHSHRHKHATLTHKHPHFPDLHHTHRH